MVSRMGSRLLARIGLIATGMVMIGGDRVSGDTPELPPPAVQSIDFETHVLPILNTHCIACHGPKKQESSYRVDHKPTALRGGESGETAILPGKGGESPLLERVASTVDSRRMPPMGDPLSRDQIAILRAWIDQGATWPDHASVVLRDPREHWAYQPPRRATLPAIKTAHWAKNEIDLFILEKLESAHLAPASPADRLTLMRRLYLDLIGLPPTLEQIDRFMADPSDVAYHQLIEELLDSPHYGERWGRHWLDAARYADSDGFEKDKLRWVWAYREWVIQALNRDLPYDQFIVEQIAGDLLPDATQDQRVATGFLRNSMINEEGGIDPEQFRMEAMFDRMDAIGKSILGLTIQCGQCHNHKYDPLTQTDYYRLFAFLNNCHEANTVVYTAEEQSQRTHLFQQIRGLEQELQQGMPDWLTRMTDWAKPLRDERNDWQIVKPESDITGDQKHYVLEDGSILAAGYAPTQFTTEFVVHTDAKDVQAVRLELLCHHDLPLNGPGRSIHGLAALTEFRLLAGPRDGSSELKEVKLKSATADVNPPETEIDKQFDDKSGRRRVTGPIEFALDGKDETAWGIDAGAGRRNVPRQAVFVLDAPLRDANGLTLKFQLVQNHGGWNSDDNQNQNLGCFRFSVSNLVDAQADPIPPAIRRIAAGEPSAWTAADRQDLFSFWRTTVPEWRQINERIEAIWRQHPPGSSQLVLHERSEPRVTHVLRRGDFLHPQRAVEPGVPSFLHPLPAEAPLNRLSLARWLVDRKSPTTARAYVNRIWQAYFGTGLVATSEDLGVQGEMPTHRELLDWLAVDFMEQGWSIKSLHRKIVKSATYQQSSAMRPELDEHDPGNRLLGRAPRLRVDAEVVRDMALAASGLLDRTIGGPSVYPPLPAFMLQPPVSYGPKVWPEEAGANRYRRAIYTFRYRSVPYPVMQNFDAPNGDFSCVRRTRSNTPLQALTTLNEPLFMECARGLALTTLRWGGETNEQRVNYAFRRCLSRPPSAAESRELCTLLSDQQSYISQGWVNAWELATGDPAKRVDLPAHATPTQLAAWTSVARVLLNLDEAITRQ